MTVQFTPAGAAKLKRVLSTDQLTGVDAVLPHATLTPAVPAAGQGLLMVQLPAFSATTDKCATAPAADCAAETSNPPLT